MIFFMIFKTVTNGTKLQLMSKLITLTRDDNISHHYTYIII